MDVDIDFAADLLPQAAERVVFGKVAFAFGIDHAVEEAVVQPFVFAFVVAVGDIVQFGVGCHHFFEHAAFDDHESGRCVVDFHKAFFIDAQHDFAVFVFIACVDGVGSVHPLEIRLGRTGGNAFIRPVFAFQRINAGNDVFIRQQQAVERFGGKADVGVYPEEVRPFFVFQKGSHAIIARAGNQALAALHHHLQRPAVLRAGVDDVEQRKDVIVEIFPVVAGGHDDGVHLRKSRFGQHSIS